MLTLTPTQLHRRSDLPKALAQFEMRLQVAPAAVKIKSWFFVLRALYFLMEPRAKGKEPSTKYKGRQALFRQYLAEELHGPRVARLTQRAHRLLSYELIGMRLGDLD